MLFDFTLLYFDLGLVGKAIWVVALALTIYIYVRIIHFNDGRIQ